MTSGDDAAAKSSISRSPKVSAVMVGSCLASMRIGNEQSGIAIEAAMLSYSSRIASPCSCRAFVELLYTRRTEWICTRTRAYAEAPNECTTRHAIRPGRSKLHESVAVTPVVRRSDQGPVVASARHRRVLEAVRRRAEGRLPTARQHVLWPHHRRGLHRLRHERGERGRARAYGGAVRASEAQLRRAPAADLRITWRCRFHNDEGRSISFRGRVEQATPGPQPSAVLRAARCTRCGRSRARRL